ILILASESGTIFPSKNACFERSTTTPPKWNSDQLLQRNYTSLFPVIANDTCAVLCAHRGAGERNHLHHEPKRWGRLIFLTGSATTPDRSGPFPLDNCSFRGKI